MSKNYYWSAGKARLLYILGSEYVLKSGPIYIVLYENLFQPLLGRHASTPRKEKREEERKGKGSRPIG